MDIYRIDHDQAEKLWAGRHPQGANYGGPPKIAQGTGRASCRLCGRKIAKGDAALTWAHDFQGSGSWTAIQSYVHGYDCTASGE